MVNDFKRWTSPKYEITKVNTFEFEDGSCAAQYTIQDRASGWRAYITNTLVFATSRVMYKRQRTVLSVLLLAIDAFFRTTDFSQKSHGELYLRLRAYIDKFLRVGTAMDLIDTGHDAATNMWLRGKKGDLFIQTRILDRVYRHVFSDAESIVLLEPESPTEDI